MNRCEKLRPRDFYGKILWAIKKYFDLVGLKNVKLYVVGSLAKNEELCIEDDSMEVSDLDLIAFMDMISYMKCLLTGYHKKVFELLLYFLSMKKIRTKISFSIFPYSLYRLGLLKPNTIYLYEAKPVICIENEKRCVVLKVKNNVTIDPYDILNLVISSMADYIAVLVKQNQMNINNGTLYVTAKRVLTVLYVLELYEGLSPFSFAETPQLAKRFKLVDEEDLPLLEICARIKRGEIGNVHDQYTSQDYIRKLSDLFEKYAHRFLLRFSKSKLNVKDPMEIVVALHRRYRLSWKAYFTYIIIYLALYFTDKLFKRGSLRSTLTRLIMLLRYRIKLEDLIRLLVLRYALNVLTVGRQIIDEGENFKSTSAKLIEYWHKYMV